MPWTIDPSARDMLSGVAPLAVAGVAVLVSLCRRIQYGVIVQRSPPTPSIDLPLNVTIIAISSEAVLLSATVGHILAPNFPGLPILCSL